MDTANLALGGLVLGQFLSAGNFDLVLGLLGIAAWLCGMAGGVFLLYFGRR
jgi:hypothetical protein